MALLDDLILRFSKTTTKFDPAKVLESSITKAHADMSRRATGHKPEIQEESIRWLANRFKKFSPFACKKQEDFDKWHEDTCIAYCEELNLFAVRKGFSFIMTYGRAQKVLNMTFKYLYCTSAYKADVVKIISFLHMTLDGYTLRWYKEVVVKYINDKRPQGTAKLKVGDVSDWSKMNEVGKHQYIDIQKRVRDYLHSASDYQYTINTSIVDDNVENSDESKKELIKNGNTITVNVPFDPKRNSPFFAEFIVWEGEIARAKIDNLLKGLNSTYMNWSNNQWAVNNAVKADLRTKLSILYKSI